MIENLLKRSPTAGTPYARSETLVHCYVCENIDGCALHLYEWYNLLGVYFLRNLRTQFFCYINLCPFCEHEFLLFEVIQHRLQTLLINTD